MSTPLYEFSIWAEGYCTDAAGNRLDAEGNIVPDPEPPTETEDPQEES